MEKSKIEEGAKLLHRLKRVTCLIKHIQNIGGEVIKLTIGNEGAYPVDSYYAPVSRDVANDIITSLEKEKESLESKIRAL